MAELTLAEFAFVKLVELSLKMSVRNLSRCDLHDQIKKHLETLGLLDASSGILSSMWGTTETCVKANKAFNKLLSDHDSENETVQDLMLAWSKLYVLTNKCLKMKSLYDKSRSQFGESDIESAVLWTGHLVGLRRDLNKTATTVSEISRFTTLILDLSTIVTANNIDQICDALLPESKVHEVSVSDFIQKQKQRVNA